MIRTKTHTLKAYSEFFVEVLNGMKRFDLRKDEGFVVGDNICLEEFDRDKGVYTGRKLTLGIDYIQKVETQGLPEGYVILNLVH